MDNRTERSITIKVRRERHARTTLHQHDYVLEKARTRSWRKNTFGTYRIVDANGNVVPARAAQSGYDFTLADVEEWIERNLTAVAA